MQAKFAISLVVALVAGCGGGGGSNSANTVSGSCTSISGGASTLTADCTGCTVQDRRFAADGSLSSFAQAVSAAGSATANVTIRATAQSGVVFPAGSAPGVFFTPQRAPCTNCAVTVTTYLSGAPQESRPGSNNSSLSGDGASVYVGFTATLPFDALEVTETGPVTPMGGAEIFRVYELCSDSSPG